MANLDASALKELKSISKHVDEALESTKIAQKSLDDMVAYLKDLDKRVTKLEKRK